MLTMSLHLPNTILSSSSFDIQCSFSSVCNETSMETGKQKYGAIMVVHSG